MAATSQTEFHFSRLIDLEMRPEDSRWHGHIQKEHSRNIGLRQQSKRVLVYVDYIGVFSPLAGIARVMSGRLPCEPEVGHFRNISHLAGRTPSPHSYKY